jgi:hypothetical protein
MKPLGDTMHHVELVRRMARVAGVDLVEAYDRGDLSHSDWAQIVQSCRKCAIAGRCVRWLECKERERDLCPDGGCACEKHSAKSFCLLAQQVEGVPIGELALDSTRS